MAIVIVAITHNCWENRIKIILCVIINYNFMVNGENSNVIILFIYLFGEDVTLTPDRQADRQTGRHTDTHTGLAHGDSSGLPLGDG